MSNNHTPSKRRQIKLAAVFTAILLIFFLTLTPAPGDTQPIAANVQPALLAMVDAQPDANVRVIVYKASVDASLESLVTELEGAVVRDLRLINALVVELPAKTIPTLARSSSVAQISLDGTMMSASVTTKTVRDEFSSASFSNNDGSQNWAGDWLESGESDGPESGDLRVSSFLRIRDDNRSLRRAVDLSGATAATLSFDYRRYRLDSSSDYIAIEASADGGASWTELDRFAGSGNDRAFQPASYDIAAYASADTAIRFSASSSLGGWDYLYVDNLQIEFIVDHGENTAGSDGDSGSFPSTVNVRDEFNAVAYNNNDGSTDWENDWIEYDVSGSGPAQGLVVIANGELTLKDGIDSNPSIAREVDISNAAEVAFNFNFRTGSGVEAYEDRIAVEVSSDGGASYTLLEIIENGFTSGSKNYDITPYASADTMIRFRVDAAYGGPEEYFAVDNVQIKIGLPRNYYLDTLNVRPVWKKGIQGQGVTIAVIDSGLSLKDDFDSRVLTRVVFNEEAQTNSDSYGHGTHVAGIAAGNGTATNGLYKGIAPQANLVGLKVSDEYGMAYESDTVAALQWVFDNKDAYNIRIVNLSLNSTLEQSYNDSPLDAAVEILWLNGIVVVASSGNSWGPHNTTNAAPANDPFIITVGASEEGHSPEREDDWVAAFTEHGITKDGFRKPEVIAPGKGIISALASNSWWQDKYPERKVTGDYFRISGTSMAAPMVSGAVALLLQAEPNLTPDQVKYRLMNTGSPIYFNGEYPYLDVYDLLNTPTTESANANAIPHQLLAKMALIAYWASENGDENIDWANVDWDAVDWDAVNWDAVDWGSVNWGSVNWGSVNWGSVNWGSVNWGSVNWGSVNWGSVNWGSVNWGSVNWGSVNWGSVDFNE
ncbi:MAG: S8 family serine peptidase [Chloroflexi bacterium]|nr:S8 family serine peptidase [Chloroflexota bacterium]